MSLSLALKGAAMGIAEAIPGVSGGTIAFITGIYQELLETIKSFTPSNLRLILSDRKTFWKAINGQFLLWLLLGMVLGLVSGILVISHLLENYQSLLWAFFFGLVLASAIYLSRDIKWDAYKIILSITGAIITYFITTLVPASGSENPLYLFLAGCIAISALMLPGLSGSFMLLLLGLYHQIINGLKSIISELDFSQVFSIGIFAAGALTGLFSFARVLSYLFKKFPGGTMATMIGVLVGSLFKLWPWKVITSVMNKKTGEVVSMNAYEIPDEELYKIITEQNLSPSSFSKFHDPQTILVVVCFIAGMILVGFLSKMSNSPAQ